METLNGDQLYEEVEKVFTNTRTREYIFVIKQWIVSEKRVVVEKSGIILS